MIMEMTCKVETITPEMAKRYLEHNCENNRNISDRRVRMYADDMKAGAWQLNGEAIRFNKNGKLIDGQHRLKAVVLAGIPVKILVIRNVDDNVDLYDRGMSRSTYASLLMSGIDKSIANNLSCAVAKLALAMKFKSNVFSDNQIREFLLDNKDNLIKALSIGGKYSSQKSQSMRIGTNTASFVLALFNAINHGESEEDLDDFCEIVSTGFYNNKNQSAAIVCRNDFLSNAIDYRSGMDTRIKAVCQIEKAIYDFCRRVARVHSYVNWDKSVYNNRKEN